MPWKKVSTVDLREEFVMLASRDGSNMRELCRRYAISPTTGYKWLARHAAAGLAGLSDHSRRPHTSPGRTAPVMEERIVALRRRHPAWGARKLQRRLRDCGESGVPSISTITEILRRHGCIDADRAVRHRAFIRFEHAAPNDLWQMDFKGHFALPAGRCHPLSVIDDHSRFALGLEACGDERAQTVQQRLTGIFQRYGLPWRMLMDNGAPWGDDGQNPHTKLTVWLLRLDIAVSHGRPYHPQTQGKAERFHRSIVAEVLGKPLPRDLTQCQQRFDAWRQVYNHERPHQAIGLEVPATRYRSGARPFPEALPPLAYDSTAIVRRVDVGGCLSFHNRRFRVGKAFQGQSVAIRPTTRDGCFDICFGRHPIASIDLTGAS